MPHIILETTSDLVENAHVPDILEALVAQLASFESVSTASIKAYHSLRSVWAVGEGHPPGFAHCTVKLLEGRSPELKRQMAARLFEVLREQFEESALAGEVGLTLEVHEMDQSTYQKA